MITYDWLAGTFTLSYFLGSIPFGLILTRAAGLEDIRKTGSGNIGATNVMRTGHTVLGVFTFLLDAWKGAAAVIFCRYIYNYDLSLFAGLFVVIGHAFPVWLHFKGGKGVATTIGVLFGLHWLLGIAVCVTWLIAFQFSRTSSVSSLLSIAWSSVAAYLIADVGMSAMCLALAGLIFYTHRSNIERLITGTEHHFKEKPL